MTGGPPLPFNPSGTPNENQSVAPPERGLRFQPKLGGTAALIAQPPRRLPRAVHHDEGVPRLAFAHHQRCAAPDRTTFEPRTGDIMATTGNSSRSNDGIDTAPRIAIALVVGIRAEA